MANRPKARRRLFAALGVLAALGLTVLFVAVTLGLGYLVFVVPGMEARWADLGVDLPIPAKIMIRASHAANRWSLLLALIEVASLLGLIAVWFVVAKCMLPGVADEPGR